MQTIGPYKILKTIAMGGMGEVYLAALEREGGFEKQVALKCVLPRLMADSRFLEFFEREARLAAVLTHRNIVPVFDFGRDQGRAWLAMEYVHGVDVKAVYDHIAAPLPTGLALGIAMSCARALDYAHRARDARGRALNIIHRDVSPQNILLSFEGDVKIADFGLAQATARENHEEGTLKGKFAYMSPEQAEGRAVDGRSDQFSLAIVLFELLSGTRAFFTDEGAQTILQRVSKAEVLAPLSDVAPATPLQIVQVIERALSRDRRERFPDAGAFADALQAAANSCGVTIGQPEVGAWLRALFPARAVSQRMRTEQTVEATAVAADPITLNRYEDEGTAVAGTPVQGDVSVGIGLENTASAEHVRPSAVPATDSSAEEPVTDEVSATDPAPSRALPRTLLYLALVLGVASFLLWNPGDKGTDTPDPKVQSVDLRKSTSVSPVDAVDVDAAQALAAIDASIKTSRDAGQPQVLEIKPVPLPDAGRQTVRRVKGVTRRAPKKEARSSRRRQRRQEVRAKADAAVPKTNQIPPEKDAGIQETRPSKPEVITTAPEPIKTVLDGVRLRVEGAKSVWRGVAPRDGWYPLSRKAILGKIPGASGQDVKVRAYAREGTAYARFGVKPYGDLYVNGVLKGAIPGPGVPLLTGRSQVEIKVPNGPSSKFTIHVAD